MESTRMTRLILAGIAAAAISSTTVVQAAEDAALPVDVELTADVVTKYVWRGQLLSDDPALQPGASISFKGLTLGVWGSMYLSDGDGTVTDIDPGRLQEVDYTVSYGFSPVEGLDLEAGLIWYSFPEPEFDSTGEVYGSITLSMVPYLSPSLTVYYDFDEVEGFYGTLGIGHTFELADCLSLSLGASVAYADSAYNLAYFGVDDDGFNDGVLNASLDYAVGDNFSLSVYVSYSEMLDRDVKNAAEAGYGDSENVVVGLNATFAF